MEEAYACLPKIIGALKKAAGPNGARMVCTYKCHELYLYKKIIKRACHAAKKLFDLKHDGFLKCENE